MADTLRQRIEHLRDEIAKSGVRGIYHAMNLYRQLTAALALPDAAPGEGQCNHGALSGVLVGQDGVWTEHPHPHAAIWLDVAEHPPTDQCPDMECMVCGMRDCPDREPLHYHHDGCPCCAMKPPCPDGPEPLSVEDLRDLDSACGHLASYFRGTVGEKSWRDLAAKCRAHAEARKEPR